MAVGDYPPTIDYILNLTKQKDLYFIGHSMGGTQYLVIGPWINVTGGRFDRTGPLACLSPFPFRGG